MRVMRGKGQKDDAAGTSMKVFFVTTTTLDILTRKRSGGEPLQQRIGDCMGDNIRRGQAAHKWDIVLCQYPDTM